MNENQGWAECFQRKPKLPKVVLLVCKPNSTEVWSYLCCTMRTKPPGGHSLAPFQGRLSFLMDSNLVLNTLPYSYKCIRLWSAALEKTKPWGYHSHAETPSSYHLFYIKDSHLNFRFWYFADSCSIHANDENYPKNLERKLDWSQKYASKNQQFLQCKKISVDNFVWVRMDLRSEAPQDQACQSALMQCQICTAGPWSLNW